MDEFIRHWVHSIQEFGQDAGSLEIMVNKIYEAGVNDGIARVESHPEEHGLRKVSDPEAD